MSTAPQQLPPLDVLTYAAEHGLWGLGGFGKQIRAAREVFAELIAADREYDAAVAAQAHDGFSEEAQRSEATERCRAAYARRQSALAAFGGDA